MQQQRAFVLQKNYMYGSTMLQDGKQMCELCRVNLKPDTVEVSNFVLSFPWLIDSISRGICTFVVG